MSNENEIRDRMTRVESKQEHQATVLDRLVEISDRMANNVSQLVAQRGVTDALAEDLKTLKHEHLVLRGEVKVINSKLKPLEDLPKVVERSDLISSAGLWVAGTLFVGFVSLAIGLIQGWITL